MFKWIGAVLLSICLVSQTNAEWVDLGDGVYFNSEELRMIPNGFQFYLATSNPAATSWLEEVYIKVEGNPLLMILYEVDCKTSSMSLVALDVSDEQGAVVLTMHMGKQYRASVMPHFPSNFSKHIKGMCQYYGFKV